MCRKCNRLQVSRDGWILVMGNTMGMVMCCPRRWIECVPRNTFELFLMQGVIIVLPDYTCASDKLNIQAMVGRRPAEKGDYC